MIRIGLYILTNLAVMFVLLIVTKVLGVDRYLAAAGIPYAPLLVFAVVVGFTGSFISLLISKWMAKMAYGIKVIGQPENEDEKWLCRTVGELARDAELPMPEVGIYDSPEANAFATGATKSGSIVAVSTGLIAQMSRDQLKGVLAHEVSHIANGDMVTMSLLQGVLNTFVIVLSRVAGFAIDNFINRGDRDEDNRGGVGIGYFLSVMVCQIVFGIAASLIVMGFSRWREFRADEKGARLAGRKNMIGALKQLKAIVDANNGQLILDSRSQSLNAFKISGSWHDGVMRLFSTHPPLDERIKALEENIDLA
jgi:heat shock protein HtpX